MNRRTQHSVQTLKSRQWTVPARRARALTAKARATLAQQYHTAKRRALLLDYDGTLVPFVDDPKLARPDNELMRLLGTLCETVGNEVAIVSGRPRCDLEEWFGSVRVALVAEHGAWLRLRGEEWQMLKIITADWKDLLRPMLQMYVDHLQGALLEEKEFSLAWHYRKADPRKALLRAKELLDDLSGLTKSLGLQVLKGNKVLEVRNTDVNKGTTAMEWLGGQGADFIMAIGDDSTDEDLFCALPPTAHSVRVGLTQTAARYHLCSHVAVRRLLSELVGDPGVNDAPLAFRGNNAGGAAKANRTPPYDTNSLSAQVAANTPVHRLMAGGADETPG